MSKKAHEEISERPAYVSLLRIIKALNVILMTVPFCMAWFLYYADRMFIPFWRIRNYYLVILLFLILYAVCGRVYDAFLVSYNTISEIVYSQILAVLITDVIMYIVLYLLIRKFPNVLPMLLVLAVQIAISAVWAYFSHKWYFHVFPPKETAVIWDAREGMDKQIDSYGLDKKFRVIKKMTAQECITDLSVLDEVETVFISGVHSHERNIVIKYCIAHKITAFIIPRIGDVLMRAAKPMHMFHLPIMRLARYNPLPEYQLVKRLFDILLSFIAIVITSPIMLVTAVCIKGDGGPVLYRQKRLTKDGKAFFVLKFRSMRVDAEKDGIARLSTGDADDRVTRVGRVIRKLRIDELPQFFNILKGEMSLIGPRPERPEIAAEYERDIPEFRLRLQVKAGLTGYAQVYGKYNTTPYDKLQMDLMYIANPSLIQDLQILIATIKILFLPESTEGVKKGQTTAKG